MAGVYCKFCDHRCFVYRIVPGSNVTHLATCAAGMAFDREQLGVDHTTAVNPAAEPPVFVCTTDSDACTCGAPVSTPAGMHHDDCPTNPASRLTAEELEASRRRVDEVLAQIRTDERSDYVPLLDGEEG